MSCPMGHDNKEMACKGIPAQLLTCFGFEGDNLPACPQFV
jgi:hypothetical protein